MTDTIAGVSSAVGTREQALAPLHRTALTATDYWNDSCSIAELTYAIERGAVGATSNPTIVGEVLGKEMHLWRERIGEIIAGNPTWTEDEITWQLIEEMAIRASELLLPIFEREAGLKGRLSIQTNPKLYRDAERLVRQATRFATLAPNMQVKIPATEAGIAAIEEVITWLPPSLLLPSPLPTVATAARHAPTSASPSRAVASCSSAPTTAGPTSRPCAPRTPASRTRRTFWTAPAPTAAEPRSAVRAARRRDLPVPGRSPFCPSAPRSVR